VRLRVPGDGPLVIGHRGAAAVAPENTLAALEAAVAARADLVEFDVGPDLRLAHSPREVPREQVSLDDALDFLRAHEIGVHLDLKDVGYESEVLEAVRRHRLLERAVISTTWPSTTRSFARLAPELTRAIGYPRDRYGVSRLRWPERVTATAASTLRQAMPLRVPVLLHRAHANALALHYTLCSRASVAAAHRRGAPVLAWTANDPATVLQLSSLGVDAIVSDDPAMARTALEG